MRSSSWPIFKGGFKSFGVRKRYFSTIFSLWTRKWSTEQVKTCAVQDGRSSEVFLGLKPGHGVDSALFARRWTFRVERMGRLIWSYSSTISSQPGFWLKDFNQSDIHLVAAVEIHVPSVSQKDPQVQHHSSYATILLSMSSKPAWRLLTFQKILGSTFSVRTLH